MHSCTARRHQIYEAPLAQPHGPNRSTVVCANPGVSTCCTCSSSRRAGSCCGCGTFCTGGTGGAYPAEPPKSSLALATCCGAEATGGCCEGAAGAGGWKADGCAGEAAVEAEKGTGTRGGGKSSPVARRWMQDSVSQDSIGTSIVYV